MAEVELVARCQFGELNDRLEVSIDASGLLDFTTYERNDDVMAIVVLSLEDEARLCQILNKRAKERAERPLEPCENIGSCKDDGNE